MTAAIRFVLVLFFTAGTAFAGEEKLTASQVLANMIQSLKTLNYNGTVVLLRNGRLETMKYFHAVRDGREQERLVALDSPLREVVRNGDLVSCRYHDNPHVVFDHRPYERSFLINFSKNLDQLADYYEFALSGEEDVAMLPAYVIDISPKDEFRFGRRVWVEKARFLPLKVAVYDATGALLEQVAFTEQQVKESLPFSEVKSEDDRLKQVEGRAVNDSNAAALPIVVPVTPAGFKPVYFTRRTMHDSRLPVEHLLLSDGLTSISVYKESRNPEMEPGLHTVGAINSFSLNIDDYQVTAMGEAPPAAVKAILENVRFNSAGR